MQKYFFIISRKYISFVVINKIYIFFNRFHNLYIILIHLLYTIYIYIENNIKCYSIYYHFLYITFRLFFKKIGKKFSSFVRKIYLPSLFQLLLCLNIFIQCNFLIFKYFFICRIEFNF